MPPSTFRVTHQYVKEVFLFIQNMLSYICKNIADTAATVSLDFSGIGLLDTSELEIKDAYTDKVIPHTDNRFHISVPGKDFRLIRIE